MQPLGTCDPDVSWLSFYLSPCMPACVFLSVSLLPSGHKGVDKKVSKMVFLHLATSYYLLPLTSFLCTVERQEEMFVQNNFIFSLLELAYLSSYSYK